MGAYIYKTKPSNVATAQVVTGDGKTETVEVALFEYAYKPYGWNGEAENRRMHRTSGAQACAAAWKRTGKKVPRLGVMMGAYRMIYPDASLFLTHGRATVTDDYLNADGSKIVGWVTLPHDVHTAEQ